MAESGRVMATIQQLAHDEHELRDREGRGQISEAERARLRSIELELDRSGTSSDSGAPGRVPRWIPTTLG